MALHTKVLAVFLIFFFSVDSRITTLPADIVGTAYDEICNDGGLTGIGSREFWRRRFYGDGNGAARSLHDISSEKSRLATGYYDMYLTPIFIFGSYQENGGSLFASVLCLLHDGYKYFKIVFIIDYFNPDGNSSFVCHEVLKEIRRLASSKQGVIVEIYQFQLPGSTPDIELPEKREIRVIEWIARSRGLMNDVDGKPYPHIISLDEIISENAYQIMVDGIVGTDFVKIQTGFYSPQLRTVLYAIDCFAQKAKVGYQNGATIVVNVLPSGMHKDHNGWLTGEHYRFFFHAVISPGWPIPALNGPDFSGAAIYWTFFKLIPPTPSISAFGQKNYTLFGLLSAKQAQNQLDVDVPTLSLLKRCLQYEVIYNCVRIRTDEYVYLCDLYAAYAEV